MNEKQALSQAMKLCSRKEYASGEIKEKLVSWELDDEMADKVVKALINEKFIDDERYGAAFVNDKLKFSKWGKIKIGFMLRQKGVDEPIIAKSLEKIEVSFYEQILHDELVKKCKTIKAASEYEFKGKLVQFAVSRGFEYDISARVTDQILKTR